MTKVFRICLVFVCENVHFHKDSLFEKSLLISNQHNLVVLNLMDQVQNLVVIDKQCEMVLYHHHVVVVRCKHSEQETRMVRSELKGNNVIFILFEKRTSPMTYSMLVYLHFVFHHDQTVQLSYVDCNHYDS
jgi:hypothetical protein